MSKYSEAAINAVRYFQDQNLDPLKAWKKACEEIFADSPSSQKKVCPKNTFLSLCEDDKVKAIPPGKYLRKQKSVNKGYAIKAIEILKEDPNEEFTPNKLWKRVTAGSEKHHNNQMDVVLALRKEKLLNI